ncbi:MAG: sigma-70 family RNA polymerase sigma factor [Gammaproteobacteria bacterium]|nr:sigma-70 family RNA polymerase sigma factor [Gammaproteobacteria bacterium]MCY4200740.1 sigma-70 family RNA polymerase sigma factor [Gammaproteobacteria bacterium]MCY4277023.1 sigma-70 family RNA polymerase sigma factor [Gammaproteobacteria bacterium]MCY4323525.1 sigma-70 family RNA polymerase sigma factor [Gammaproteobacteria bacterium]
MIAAHIELLPLVGMIEARNNKCLEDEALMAFICQGDKDALNTLMIRHMRAIYAFALSLCRNPDDAEDLTQETFVRCFTKAHTYKPGQVKVTTWLHTLTRNLAIDAFRRRRWTLESEADEFAVDLDAIEDHCSPESMLEKEDREDRFKASLWGLPERQRTALLLCYHRGFSNREAAAVLDVSLDALVSLLARARRALKVELGRGV